MFEIKVSIADDGSLTIPPASLEARGVRDGDAVVLRFENGAIRIFRLQHAIEHAQELVRRSVPPEHSLAERRPEERL